LVPLRHGATLYERFGDLPALVLAALALLAGLAAAALDRRALAPHLEERT
jgi:apolipoprotein N-acyltransferase